jgi:hypothetical protein
MVQGKAACTYCSTVCNNSSKSIPAIERWGDDRVRDAARVAKERDLKFYLLSAPVGLIPDSQSVPMSEPILRDDEVAGKVELVARQIEKWKITSLLFFAHLADRQAVACFRLILLACDRASTNLEVVTDHGATFPDWYFAQREAEEARLHALRSQENVDVIFQPLVNKYPEDGMVCFKRGEAYERRKKLDLALRDYVDAQEIFTMRQWKQKARQAADRVRKSLHPPDSEAPFQGGEGAISQLPLDAALFKLSRDALRLVEVSPAAAVSLCRTALIKLVSLKDDRWEPEERTESTLKRSIDRLLENKTIREETASAMHGLRMRRNEVEYRPPAQRKDSVYCATKLIEILKTLFPRR